MKCHKCRCEVGSQRICPYCGATVYIQNSSLKMDYGDAVPNSGGNVPFVNKDFSASLFQRMANLETKLNLVLILSIATFVLVIMTLIVIALR